MMRHLELVVLMFETQQFCLIFKMHSTFVTVLLKVHRACIFQTCILYFRKNCLLSTFSDSGVLVGQVKIFAYHVMFRKLAITYGVIKLFRSVACIYICVQRWASGHTTSTLGCLVCNF